MSFMDKFLDALRLNDDYDDFDDYDYDDFDDEDDFKEKPAKKSSARKETVVKEEPKKPISKITPITRSQKKSTGTSMEVCVIKPSAIEDELEIVDTLLAGRTVLINMEGLNVEIAQRIIDFTSGATYALRGNLQKVSNYIFLATPNGVDISGDIQNLMDAFGTGSSLDY